MDIEKRKIIVREIEHWRGSRLLPEHYCDFLMNLYAEEQAEPSKKWGTVSSASIRNSNWKVWMMLFGTIGIFFFIILNFTSFQIPMQISLSAFIILTCYVVGGMSRVKNPTLSYLAMGLGSFLLLNVGLYLLQKNDAGMFAILSYAMLSSIIWMVIGITARMPAFHFSGWMVLAIIYGWFLHVAIDSMDWLSLQMSWIPVSIVLLWLGWLFHHNHKKIAIVLFLVGFLIWFAPDVYGILLTELPSGLLQFSFIARLVVAGILLFMLRKKWTEWVA